MSKERLAAYKYPRLIEFIDALPKTATGKIRRFRLREFERERASMDREQASADRERASIDRAPAPAGVPE